MRLGGGAALFRHLALVRPRPERAPHRQVSCRRSRARAAGLDQGRPLFSPRLPIRRPSSAAQRNWPDGLRFQHHHDYSYDGVMRSYEDSLQRLGMNRVDMLVIHDLDFVNLGSEALLSPRIWRRLATGGIRALSELKAARADRGDRGGGQRARDDPAVPRSHGPRLLPGRLALHAGRAAGARRGVSALREARRRRRSSAGSSPPASSRPAWFPARATTTTSPPPTRRSGCAASRRSAGGTGFRSRRRRCSSRCIIRSSPR